jgi:hypothetical protein
VGEEVGSSLDYQARQAREGGEEEVDVEVQ